jgi:hypothetical protein
VDNPVHNRFLVTETSPPFSQLHWSAAFLTTGLQQRKLRVPGSDTTKAREGILMTQTKVMTTIRALALSATAALAIMSAASSADAPGPFIGKWALDLHKSTFQPGPSGMKSQTVTVTDAPGGATHTVMDTVGADGSSYHVEFTSASDGKPVPTTGDPDSDSVALTALNPNTVKEVFLKAGKATATGTLTVSKSGKTFQGPFYGTNADGSKWKNHFVYVRQ